MSALAFLRADLLDASPRVLRGVIEAIPAAILVVAPDRRIVVANTSAGTLFGYNPDALLDQEIATLIPAPALLRRLAPHGRLPPQPSQKRHALSGRHSNGQELLLDVALSRIDCMAGRCTLALVTDSSDRERLEHNEALLASIVESSDDAIISKSLQSTITSWNAGAQAILGWTAAEMIGTSILAIIPPDRAAEEQQILERIRRGQHVEHYETLRLRRDGALVPVSLTVSPIRDRRGRVIGASKILRDITQRRRDEQALRDAHATLEQRVAERTRDLALQVERRQRAEAALVQAQRMEAMGQLAAGVAHDFNNLLQGMLGAVTLLRERPGLDADARRSVALLEGAVGRATGIVHRLLAYARRQPLHPAPLSPAAFLAGFAPLLTYALNGEVHVAAQVEPGAGAVLADAAELENCLLNLAVNARDAMPAGGVLQLAIGDAGADEIRAAGLPDGAYARFTVADSGAGMAAEVAARAFEPFFTTKAIGKGTGLGLAMVQGFVRQSGGEVLIESTPGKGTTVRFWLPRSATPASATAAPPPDQPGDARASRGRLLVVDDDSIVLDVLTHILRNAGFEPCAVESAEEALDRLRGGAACDMLITDLAMPGMTGAELIRQVAQLRPSLPALLISGSALVPTADALPASVTVLRKPFERETLLRHIEAMIAPAACSRAIP